MITEPLFAWMLLIGGFMILFYICIVLYMLLITVRDYLHRKDQDNE